MNVVGLDLSNTYCGVAAVGGADHKPDLLLLDAVPGAGVAEAGKTARRVLALLDERALPFTIQEVWYERPPPQGSKGEHGRKLLEIGYGLGWANGLVVGPLMRDGYPCTEVMPATWRETMLATAATWGKHVLPPGDKPPARILSKGVEVVRGDAPGGYVVRFPCGHEVKVHGGLSALSARVERPCSECAHRAAAPPDALDWKSDEWKRIACELVAAFWPVPYGVLVAAARARARVDPPDHRLAGVHDACEAVWVAMHGMASNRGMGRGPRGAARTST